MNMMLFSSRFFPPLCVLIIGVGVAVWAAPVAPQREDLPDDIKGLGGLKRLWVQVRPLPAPLLEASMTKEALEKQVRTHLQDAGFQLIEGAGNDAAPAPALVLSVELAHDPDLPDTVGYGVFIELMQRTHVYRIDDDLTIPTATLFVLEIGKVSALKRRIPAAVDDVTETFVQMQRLAEVSK